MDIALVEIEVAAGMVAVVVGVHEKDRTVGELAAEGAKVAVTKHRVDQHGALAAFEQIGIGRHARMAVKAVCNAPGFGGNQLRTEKFVLDHG